MIGITAVNGHIPSAGLDSADLVRQFGVDVAFLEKIGIQRLAKKGPEEQPSDLCVKAFAALCEGMETPPSISDIDFLCVCTQNGDYSLPQTSAVVHAKLGLPAAVASFDLALGCSGYVYGLSVAKSFMEANGLSCGLLFTADPYSGILDMQDKHTALLFGDAASVTLLTDSPRLTLGTSVFDTFGDKHEALIRRPGQPLFMDGREIFNLVMRSVPRNIERCLKTNGLGKDDVDLFVLHQANKYVIGGLTKLLGIPPEKVPFDIRGYGNTVSSSIPLVLRDYLTDDTANTMLVSGFGVGLQAASTILTRATA